MKFLLLSTIALFSLSSFAYFDEAKCIGLINKTNVLVEVERGTGNPWRNSTLLLNGNGTPTYQEFDMTMRYTGPGYVRYESKGYSLEVDFTPDETPQLGQIYPAKFFSRTLMGNLKCALNW